MMNTMKKTISILIAVLMVLCLAACGNPEKTETEEQRTPAAICMRSSPPSPIRTQI